MNRRTPERRRRRRAYTLVEMLIALVVFAIITTATGFALTAAVRGQQTAQQRADELQEVRTLLSIIGRDLRSAYASLNGQNTFFVAEDSGSGLVLTFTTLGNRIVTGVNQATGEIADPSSFPPQSDVAVVRYMFDPDRSTLSRAVSSIPDPGALPPPDTPDTLLSNRVLSLSFQFLDPENGLRPDWNFINASSTMGGSTQSNPQAAPTTTGDTRLPAAVQVTIEMESSVGRSAVFTTTITLATPEPQPRGQTPDEPQGGGGGNGGGGNGGGGGGNNGGGGGGQGGGSGGGGGGYGGGGLPGLPGAPGLRP